MRVYDSDARECRSYDSFQINSDLKFTKLTFNVLERNEFQDIYDSLLVYYNSLLVYYMSTVEINFIVVFIWLVLR